MRWIAILLLSGALAACRDDEEPGPPAAADGAADGASSGLEGGVRSDAGAPDAPLARADAAPPTDAQVVDVVPADGRPASDGHADGDAVAPDALVGADGSSSDGPASGDASDGGLRPFTCPPPVNMAIDVFPSPSVHDFGTVRIGEASGPFGFKLGPFGETAAPMLVVSIEGTNREDFEVLSNDCLEPSPARAICTATVRFRPHSSGRRNASVTFRGSGACPIISAGALTGSAAAP